MRAMVILVLIAAMAVIVASIYVESGLRIDGSGRVCSDAQPVVIGREGVTSGYPLLGRA